MKLQQWTDAQLSDFSLKLEDYHRVFQVFWTLASISFTDSEKCPTAQVYLKGRPRMVINEAWWNSLNERTQVFVIVHECLHAMLGHGFRTGKDRVPRASPKTINVAQDITINEMAESLFGISRHELDSWEKYCWIITCFPNDPTVKANETFVYYLELLAKQAKEPEQELLDGHEGDDEYAEEMRDEDEFLADELYDVLSPEELEKIANVLGSGIGDGYGLAGYLDRQAVKQKLHVAKLIKGFRTAASSANKPHETFVMKNRRFSTMPSGLMLPGAYDGKRAPNKFGIALCLDVSGSVVHLRPQFFALRELFLKEKDLLEVRSYVFADRIEEITSETDRYDVGGGNDPFQIIERQLTKQITVQGKKITPSYPDCVIVITDGVAGMVSPKYPKRWLWMMTGECDYSSIPAASRRVKIEDVIFT